MGTAAALVTAEAAERAVGMVTEVVGEAAAGWAVADWAIWVTKEVVE